MDPFATPRTQIAFLADGYVATQLLYIAIELRLPDALADGPRTAAEVAGTVGVDPDVLHRVMRGLAAFGVLAEVGDSGFELTPAGSLLRDGVPGSMRGVVLARGALYYEAFGKLLDSVRSGGNAFERAYGSRFFDYLKANQEIESAFQQSMTDRSRQETESVVSAYDFSESTKVIDVGGGRGALIKAILTANPGVSGILFDQPDVVAHALPTLPASCERVGGDFFVEVPAGADTYVISRVVHDWGDQEARQILANVRKAMPAGSKLVLVEAVLPERAIDQPIPVRLDLHMLAMFTGRERTEAEWAELLAVAGLRLDQVIPIDEVVGLHILVALPG